jgi:hypothetical protein
MIRVKYYFIFLIIHTLSTQGIYMYFILVLVYNSIRIRLYLTKKKWDKLILNTQLQFFIFNHLLKSWLRAYVFVKNFTESPYFMYTYVML